jgi:S-phase kinase-associated protein 1
MDNHIHLVTKEGCRVEVNARLADFSGLIKTVLADMDSGEDIPLHVLPKASLDLILEYFSHYDFSSPPSIPCPLPTGNLRDAISSWDLEFVSRFDNDALCEFYNLVDYLQISVLNELCAATIASWFKGKTPQQLKEQFNMPSDFTPEIEEQLKAKHPWAKDDYEEQQ